MLFGLGLPETTGLLPLAERADRDGLDLVTVSDHPYLADHLDAYAALGVVLGRTRRVAVAANVTNLPLRPAPMLARTVAALSALSGGRVVLGVGAGGRWADIVRLGAEPRTPAEAVRAMEEGIVVIRALFGGGAPVTFAGEFHRVDGIAPVGLPAPPIWTGANGPKSLAVTGRRADGWIPGHAADWLSRRYRESRPVIDAAATAAGREPADIATIYNFPGRITAAPLRRTRDDAGRWIGGSAEQWAEELTGAVLEHGAGGFILFPADPVSRDDASIERWAGEVAPAVREAVVNWRSTSDSNPG
ncbi:LLM class flavin-dependent oxidoreductase [Dactylosporangium darangshiense]|uniref:LLM class flavin-dependent oxidoreductase n=1 Tax=Dactylosporangium darangshiense TaxID=579108 RepID=A0ABP8DDM1_9ACTN